MTTELENELKEILLKSCEESEKLGYNAGFFRGKINRDGAVETIKFLIDRPKPSTKFIEFLNDNNLKFSAEALINKNPKFNELFAGTAVVETARERLEKYGYKLVIKKENIKMTNPQKQEITMDIIKEIYPIAMDVHSKNKTLDEGVEYLMAEVAMKKTTAKIYIRFFVKMKEGKLHQNKMAGNIMATRYCLNKIIGDSGKDGLEAALESLWKYIEYYEGLKGGHPLPGFRAIHNEFSAKLK